MCIRDRSVLVKNSPATVAGGSGCPTLNLNDHFGKSLLWANHFTILFSEMTAVISCVPISVNLKTVASMLD